MGGIDATVEGTWCLKCSPFLTFYDFPISMRRSIYSTNLIEAFNKKIKRYVKRKEQFPNEDALERFLVSQFLDYYHKFGLRCHRG